MPENVRERASDVSVAELSMRKFFFSSPWPLSGDVRGKLGREHGSSCDNVLLYLRK
jgi:hypothetical protein